MATRPLTLAFMIYSICIVAVRAADPDPVADFTPRGLTDFVLRDSLKNGQIFEGPGGTRAVLNTSIFPALISEGLTIEQFSLKPCGLNQPHTHPRATELLTMISGGPMQAGFVDTSGDAHIYIVYPGDIIIFPRGLLHYEVNVGTETAVFLSGLNSANPGVLPAAESVLALPRRAAAGAFNQDLKTVEKLKNAIYPGFVVNLQLVQMAGCVPGQDITIDF